MADPVKRVLVYRLGSLGDMVMALPALYQVERAFPMPHTAAIYRHRYLRYTNNPSGTKDRAGQLRRYKERMAFSAHKIVSALGLEPRTSALKGRCSTN